MSRVLVIDDDEVARELLASTLRGAGHDVVELPSPIGATRVIVEQRIEAVVIDVMMPALRGDRLAKLLRGNPLFDDLGVVLVSGDDSVELQRIAEEVGADSVVGKAMAGEALAAAVAAATAPR